MATQRSRSSGWTASSQPSLSNLSIGRPENVMHVRFKKSSVESGLIVHTMAGVSSTMSRRRSLCSRNARSVRLRRVRWTSRPAIASPRIARAPKRIATMTVIRQKISPDRGGSLFGSGGNLESSRNAWRDCLIRLFSVAKSSFQEPRVLWALLWSRNVATYDYGLRSARHLADTRRREVDQEVALHETSFRHRTTEHQPQHKEQGALEQTPQRNRSGNRLSVHSGLSTYQKPCTSMSVQIPWLVPGVCVHARLLASAVPARLSTPVYVGNDSEIRASPDSTDACRRRTINRLRLRP